MLHPNRMQPPTMFQHQYDDMSCARDAGCRDTVCRISVLDSPGEQILVPRAAVLWGCRRYSGDPLLPALSCEEPPCVVHLAVLCMVSAREPFGMSLCDHTRLRQSQGWLPAGNIETCR